jgi:hypothetical protein
MDVRPNVVAALAAVMEDVREVGKDGFHDAPGAKFKFRGIDAVPEKVWQRLVVADSGCWEWTGAATNGYGRVRWEGRSRPVHRLMVEWATGAAVPAGMDSDHLCRNPACANPNPDHLEVVTHAENIRRGRWSAGAAAKQLAKNHCPSGHEFTAENTYVPPGKPHRQCRECVRAAKRRYRARRAVAA